MDYTSLVLLMVIHVIFDFVLQDRETAKNKSSKFSYLLGHLTILMIGLMFFASVTSRYTAWQGISWAILNIVAHGLIDWNIWRLYKLTVLRRFKGADGTFKYWDDGMFYNFIALDQMLHGLCYLGFDYLVRLT